MSVFNAIHEGEMTEVTKSWPNIGRTAEREPPLARGSAVTASFAVAERDTLQYEARRLRPQDFADSGPPGSLPHQN
jgi:hypothetical protein